MATGWFSKIPLKLLFLLFVKASGQISLDYYISSLKNSFIIISIDRFVGMVANIINIAQNPRAEGGEISYKFASRLFSIPIIIARHLFLQSKWDQFIQHQAELPSYSSSLQLQPSFKNVSFI